MSFFRRLLECFLASRPAAAPSGSATPEACPSCGEGLSAADLGAFRCRPCAGLWVPEGVMTPLLQASAEDIRHLLEGADEGEAAEGPRTCPTCSLPMDRYRFGYTSDVWVDACPKGHGLWLDAGELARVREFQRSQADEPSPEVRARLALNTLDLRMRDLRELPEPKAAGGVDVDFLP